MYPNCSQELTHIVYQKAKIRIFSSWWFLRFGVVFLFRNIFFVACAQKGLRKDTIFFVGCKTFK